MLQGGTGIGTKDRVYGGNVRKGIKRIEKVEARAMRVGYQLRCKRTRLRSQIKGYGVCLYSPR